MSAATGHTRSVLIVGDGLVGRAAAIALRRALPDSAVRLVQLPADTNSWLNRLGATSAVIHHFHRMIGLDAQLFARRAGAEPVHVRHYTRDGQPPIREASTATIPFVEGVPLHQIWLRHSRAAADDATDFASMLLALREARSDEGGFGVRFDPAAYQALLGEMAAALKIEMTAASDISIAANDTGISGITTDSGETLTADLYIDAAGPRSRLLGAMQVGWHDWSSWLPTLALSITPEGGGPPDEEVLTHLGGATIWQTRIWRALLTPDAAMPAPGRLAQYWHGNAVAIGEAAVRAPVSDGVGLAVALEDILRVVALLSRPMGDACEPQEYERRTEIAYRALADWSCLNLAPEAVHLSVGLDETCAAFAARGRVAETELDPIRPGEWLARLMALGPAPRRIDPTALALPDAIVRSIIMRAT